MTCRKLFVLLLVFPAALPALSRAQWSAELARDGTAVVRYDGSRVLNFNLIAWGPKWKFATAKTSLGKQTDEAYALGGDIASLNVALGGTVKWDTDKLVYEWAVKTSKPSTANVGGAFNFDLRLSHDLFNVPQIGKTELAADGNGLTWTPLPGQTVSVTFDGLDRKVAFEKGKAEQVRAWFIPPDLAVGEKTVRMTIQLPAGATFKGLPASRYADVNGQTWLTNTLDWKASPVDLSYLNDKPAGSRGFVKADGDRFVFADGTPAKFWGCNVQAYALFVAKNDAIEQQAKRIAALGYNLVRIHHHDSADWVTPNVFQKDATDTQHLDAGAMDRIDYWVKCLKDNGVYVWMDLHVGRPFRPGDNVTAFDELLLNAKTGNRQGKGMNYVNKSETQLMKEFADTYLTHVNKYTGVSYVNEPAVMGVLVTNENDITDHYGNSFLPDKKKPQHMAMYDALRDPIVADLGLDSGKAAQTWLAGPSKPVLNRVQYDWSKDFVDYLHGIGVKVPIATTNTWGSDPLFSLPALTAGDMIDVHAYGLAESLSSNPRHDANSAFWIAAAQVAGKPLAITEWNTPFPQRDRFTQPLYIAALAAFQGWDAPMIFGYQQAPMVPQTKLAEWGTSNDPAITPLMPAAALLYRRGDVAGAKQTDVLALSAEDLLYRTISPDTSAMIRTTTEQHKLQIAMPRSPLLPWLTPSAVSSEDKTTTNANLDQLPPGATSVTSDTGELKRAWQDGVFTIDTPRTQAAEGWIGGRTIDLGDVSFKIDTAKAAVVVSSMDGQPLSTSKKMLLTVAAQAGSKKANGILAEPVIGSVTFKAAPTAAAVLTPEGKPGRTLSAENGTVTLDGTDHTHWFVLTR